MGPSSREKREGSTHSSFRTLPFQRANLALRFTCLADLAAVKNEAMRYPHPLLLRHEWEEVGFDFLGRLLSCQAQAIGQTLHVRVDDNALRDAKSVAEHDIGGLASNARQSR